MEREREGCERERDVREREQWKEGEGCERESGEVRGREM